MEQRIIEFIRGLRAAGLSVSVAEELEAFQAIALLGVTDRQQFKETLRVTLVKEYRHFEPFSELFEIYFGRGEPPLQNAADFLTPSEQNLLQQALAQFDQKIQQLLQWLTSGTGPTAEELQRLAEISGIQWVDSPRNGLWVTRRMLQQLGFGQLPEKLQQLLAQLKTMGMSQESIEQLTGVMEINREELQRQIGEQVGLEIARRNANRPKELHGSDILHKSFSALNPEDIAQLRLEIQRLIRQIKTRAALRRKQGVRGKFNVRQTIRHNQRHEGVPFELKYKKKKLKPSLVFIFDVSNSMRALVEFMLHFVSELQDQVSRTRSFAFYDNLAEVSHVVRQFDMRQQGNSAFLAIQKEIPGYLWRTNLGYSLNTFFDQYLPAVDGRTTVIIMGDGRNNHTDPRLDLVKELQRRAKKLIWFTPEQERLWGSGDSDMDQYALLCDEVYPVRNLAQLSAAIDKLLSEAH